MTIAAAYLVSEGVVLGADSSTTVSVQGGVGQLLSHSQKIFEIGEKSRFGICTWGAGSFGNISHRTIIALLAKKITEDSTVENLADELIAIVKPIFDKTGIDFVGYYLGGWDPSNHAPACFKVEFKKGTTVEKKPLPLGGCEFSGTSRFFTRVFYGFDPELPISLLKELQPVVGNVADFEKLFKVAFDKAHKPLISIGLTDLPIREAIDFVYSYLHVTVKAEKFKFGAPTCGGPIEIGFISTDRPFRWVRHKPFDSAIIEQEGGDCEIR